MSVLITDSKTVALFDSVTGYAFGRTFASPELAEGFLDYMRDEDGRDPRKLTEAALDEAMTTWRETLPVADDA